MSYTLIVAGGFAVAVLLTGVYWLHEAWRGGYVALFQSEVPYNIIELKIKSFFEPVTNLFGESHEPGLPQIRLYVPKKARVALMKDMPTNVKVWQRAYMVYPNGSLERVKVRHRGDNPLNWAFPKKSWRIKTRKKRLIDRTRVFNYVVPQEADLLGNFISYDLAGRVGILSPKARMVELYINDHSYGVYVEVENLDEIFLRNNKIMPVDLYKGEQYNVERLLMVDNDLFNNPALWKKSATFNQLPKDDISNLAFIFDLIRRAETDDTALGRLWLSAPIGDWARFAAYQTLIQSWHNDSRHNQRLVDDPWRSTIIPVIHDTVVQFGANELPVLENSTQALLRLYGASSDFQIAMYRYLFRMVEGKFLEEEVASLEKLLPGLRRSLSRDSYRVQLVLTNDHPESLTGKQGMEDEWKNLLNGIRDRANWLRAQLSRPASGGWRNPDGRMELIIDGNIPVKNVTLGLVPGSLAPRRIAWDKDNNRRLSPNDTVIPFHIDGNDLVIDAVWLANRVLVQDLATTGGGKVKTAPTVFNLVADRPMSITSINASNALTGSSAPLEKAAPGVGNTPSRYNRPITKPNSPDAIVWRDKVEIKGTHIIDGPVIIEAGTVIRMYPGANLVFRGLLQVNGTTDRPVSVIPADDTKPWGVFALQGKSTAGSLISGLHARGGSGGQVDGIHYSGMVSVHNTHDVTFRNLTLGDNSIFDDMMHIIYSENIILENIHFEGAFSDGIDSDISTIRISGGTISGSGNDAIDLMSSRALVENISLVGSGDKGVSVGEDTEVLVFNTVVKSNSIGVESKDASTAWIVNSNLVANKTQINAYAKNWRYGTGGTVVLEKSIVSPSVRGLSTDKRSQISVFDSLIPVKLRPGKKRIIVDSSSSSGISEGGTPPDFQVKTASVLDNWDVRGRKDRRGVLP